MCWTWTPFDVKSTFVSTTPSRVNYRHRLIWTQFIWHWSLYYWKLIVFKRVFNPSYCTSVLSPVFKTFPCTTVPYSDFPTWLSTRNIPLCNKHEVSSLILRHIHSTVAQKESITSEITMAAKRTPTSHHSHTEKAQWYTWEKWEQKQENFSSHEFTMIPQDQQHWDMRSPVSPCRPGGHPARACLPGAQ